MKKGRYGNGIKKRVIDGETWDSVAEYNRYHELLLLQKAGVIKELQRQPKFELAPSVKFEGSSRTKPALRYFADFQYIENDKLIVEDVKGEMLLTDHVFKIKRHLMLSVHGIDIRITLIK